MVDSEYDLGYQRAVELHQQRPDAALARATKVLKKPDQAKGSLEFNLGYVHGVLDSRVKPGKGEASRE